LGRGYAPFPEENEIFLLKRHVWRILSRLVGDCLDVTAYSSDVFILSKTDITAKTG